MEKLMKDYGLKNNDNINGQKLRQVIGILMDNIKTLYGEPGKLENVNLDATEITNNLDDTERPYFEKVSINKFNETELYDKIKLPKRATTGSAGYDFFSPKAFSLAPGQSKTIYTGIRCHMPENLVLLLFPRSGHGFKYKIQLANTVGVIDSDYYNSDNEGHIAIKIFNDNNENKTLNVAEGEAFAQGIFFNYEITRDDDVSNIRNGGFGSTNSNITNASENAGNPSNVIEEKLTLG